MIKSEIITMVLALITWTGSLLTVHGQGDFKNVDCEAADVAGYGPWTDRIPVNKALPGWKAYFGSLETDLVMYNALGLGASVISIFDTNMFFGFAPLDGNYSVILDEKQYGGSPSIGQTVKIPNNSLSVVFLLRDEYSYKFEVSFEGQVLPYLKTWSGPDFDVCAADITEFVGQTGEFRFTESGGVAFIDDIQFSSEAVPEAGTMVLFALGAVLLFRVSAGRGQLIV